MIPSAHSPRQNENPVNTSIKVLKNSNKTFPVVCYFTRKLQLVSDILLPILTMRNKWSFIISISSVNMTNPQGTADLGTFTKEIFNENLIFFYISSLFRSNSKKKKKKKNNARICCNICCYLFYYYFLIYYFKAGQIFLSYFSLRIHDREIGPSNETPAFTKSINKA